ncbi:g1 s-specific cyclin [Colletotrichum incanum]|uniref:G1 s-specific cyclin n=1 Tax=Colletotrichum incanum TaxID=1573173 RepID=A0A167AXV3_COLIC|nr:g1 s-specific cyclin [Colletotrichum incanum]
MPRSPTVVLPASSSRRPRTSRPRPELAPVLWGMASHHPNPAAFLAWNPADFRLGRVRSRKMLHAEILASCRGFTDKLLVALWPVPVPAKVVDETATTLRSFLETLLRRSSASYNTLLAAFYYLVLFQSITTLPLDTTKHTPGLQKLRSLQCPRRMFLAALMLGWKFTQEQAFSTTTWATLSGLSARELNRNEAAFLSVIDWRLYISQAVFAQWDTEVSYHVQTPDVALSGALFGFGSSIVVT